MTYIYTYICVYFTGLKNMHISLVLTLSKPAHMHRMDEYMSMRRLWTEWITLEMVKICLLEIKLFLFLSNSSYKYFTRKDNTCPCDAYGQNG